MRRLAALLFISLAATAHAEGLTADQVAAAAVVSDPALAGRRADIAAARAAVDQARVAYLPRSFTASYARLSSISAGSLGDIVVAPASPSGQIAPGSTLVNAPLSFPVIRDQWSLVSRIDVPLSDYVLRLSNNLVAARRSERAAQRMAEAERRSVAASARLAYYSWARARLDTNVAIDAVRRADVHLEEVKHLLAADRASSADVLRVESQRAQAEQLRVRAENLARVAEVDLRIRLRASAGTELVIGEDLETDLALGSAGDVDAIAADAMLHRPELDALGDTAEALRAQARYQWASALPRFDIVGEVTTADPNPRHVPPVDEFHRTWSVGAQLIWSPSDTPRQLAGARARCEGREHRRAARQARRRDPARGRAGGGRHRRRHRRAAHHQARARLRRGVVPRPPRPVPRRSRDVDRAHRRRDRADARPARRHRCAHRGAHRTGPV